MNLTQNRNDEKSHINAQISIRRQKAKNFKSRKNQYGK